MQAREFADANALFAHLRRQLVAMLRPVEKPLELAEGVRPFVLRRLKRDVAPELPPRTEVVLHVELAPDERQVYDAIRAASRRGRPACNHPATLPSRSTK